MTRRGSDSPPRIVIIAGPNGAGKTTFAMEFLPREGMLREFVNADLIARGLSPFEPERAAIQAGRIMLRTIRHNVSRKVSFAFETTLSGLGYARHVRAWRKVGYHVKLLFLGLPSAELAVARVKARVAQGGHDVPEEVVRRRFDAGVRNFERVYRKLVNAWVWYDNSGPAPRLVDFGENP